MDPKTAEDGVSTEIAVFSRIPRCILFNIIEARISLELSFE